MFNCRNKEQYFSEIYNEAVILLGLHSKRMKVTLSFSSRAQFEVRFMNLWKIL